MYIVEAADCTQWLLRRPSPASVGNTPANPARREILPCGRISSHHPSPSAAEPAALQQRLPLKPLRTRSRSAKKRENKCSVVPRTSSCPPRRSTVRRRSRRRATPRSWRPPHVSSTTSAATARPAPACRPSATRTARRPSCGT